jgi:signal transduction histidine kinase
MFRSTSARFAAVYTAGFALSVIVLGVITVWLTHDALTRQFDRRVRAEVQALMQETRTEGEGSAVQAVRERESTKGGLLYGLDDVRGQAQAGRLSGLHAQLGWSVLNMKESDGDIERVRALTTALPDGSYLIVGDAVKRNAGIEMTVVEGFCWAFVGVVLIGILAGYRFSRDVHRRFAQMTAAADEIVLGEFSRRIPVAGSGDDLDRLAGMFNHTLDRISGLMDSLRQVSNDIAHDLRTPLTRLRQRLEAIQGMSRADEREVAIEGALRDVDAILATFSALLRISQVEGGARRAAFRPLDLSGIARTVVDAFAPSAEDAGQELRLESDGDAPVEGDSELLTQMLVNLVENGLRHGGEHAHVVVRTWRNAGVSGVSVADDGAGVPEGERERIFNRFYRLEDSRSTPGDGLGLALVAAIVKLHNGTTELSDANPGLRVTVAFANDPAGLRFPNVEDSLSPRRVG